MKKRWLIIVASLAVMAVLVGQRRSEAWLNLGQGGGGGGAPTGAAGGVLGGTYPNPAFNSTNAAGNLMNNQFQIDNSSHLGDPTFPNTNLLLKGYANTLSESEITMFAHKYYKFATLPACPQTGDWVIDDALDNSCTHGTPAAGGDFNSCNLICVAGTWDYDSVYTGPSKITSSDGGIGTNLIFDFPNDAATGSGFGLLMECQTSDIVNGDTPGQCGWYVPLAFSEQAGPAGLSGYAKLWDDSTTHLLSANSNNLGAGTVQTAQVANLSVFGTCGTTFPEGTTKTQNDAAVACVAGVTAAAGGSTHCQIYCNGAATWVRTGL